MVEVSEMRLRKGFQGYIGGPKEKTKGGRSMPKKRRKKKKKR